MANDYFCCPHCKKTFKVVEAETQPGTFSEENKANYAMEQADLPAEYKDLGFGC